MVKTPNKRKEGRKEKKEGRKERREKGSQLLTEHVNLIMNNHK